MTNRKSVRQLVYWVCAAVALFIATPFYAQETEQVVEAPENVLDDFTQREIIKERPVLAYPQVREADIMWEKRIWRVVDVREKINQPLAAPESPLFLILANAAREGDIIAYSTEDDKFTKRLSVADVQSKLTSCDTLWVNDNLEDFGEETLRVICNDYNWEDVKRFRIKEAWFFDARTSTLQVRILGIAPLIDVRDEEGNFRFEMPLFWFHSPSIRPLLAQHKVMLHQGNMAATNTFEDLFEMRYFSSAILKENNVADLRLIDKYAGRDLVLEGDKIEAGIFNFEHDLWSW